MDKSLLSLLACPQCHGSVQYQAESQAVFCQPCQLAFPVRDQLPVMLIEEAQQITAENV